MTRYGPGLYQVWDRIGFAAGGVCYEGRRLSLVRKHAQDIAERVSQKAEARGDRYYCVEIRQLNEYEEAILIETVVHHNGYPAGSIEATW